MLYFQNKKVKELYFQGKKVKEAWFGGRKVYSGTKTIVIEYGRTMESTLQNSTESSRTATVRFADKKDPTAKRPLNVSVEYITAPTSTRYGQLSGLVDFKTRTLSLANLQNGEIQVVEPYMEGRDKSGYTTFVVRKFIPIYKVKITITYE